MVDFNSDGTVSKPPKELVALIILEKFYNYLEADEYFTKQKSLGAPSLLATPRARLRNLFLVCHALLKRRLKPEEYAKVSKICLDLEFKPEYTDLLSAFFTITELLDKLGLIKLDTKPVYNRTRVEEANKVHGY
jgi:hypothetical protein